MPIRTLFKGRTRFTLLGSALLVSLSMAACDSSPSEALVPVLEDRVSFEAGLGAWQLRSFPESGSAGQVAQGSAADGSSYVELQPTGGTVWIERSYTLQAGRAYNVTLGVQARALAGQGTLLKGLMNAAPSASPALSEVGAVPSAWTRQLTPLTVRTDAQGRFWVMIGVRAAAGGTFGLDAVEVVVLDADSD